MDNDGILFLNIAVRCLGLYEMVCAERNIEDSFTACRKHAVAVRYKTGDICCFRLSLCLIDGIEVNKLNDNDLASFRNQKIGFVFQFHHLLPEFTAIENICIPAYIGGMGKQEATKKALELLDYLNLTNRKDHKPSQLSGGEQQRIAVARALINEPAVVLADEPSGNLDSKSAEELHKLFFRLRDEMNQTFVIVTHNPELAAMSDRTITIKDGKI